jgi:iron(III) transport system permease protein
LTVSPALRNHPSKPAWLEAWPVSLFLLLVILFYASPVLSLIGQSLTASGGGGISMRSLTRAASATVWLLLGTAFVSLVLAVPLAWLLARYRFPAHRLFEVLAVLPLALPTYLAAYCLVAFTDYFGPLQSGIRAVLGLPPTTQIAFLDLRNSVGASLVMGFALYPYVFVPARLAFSRQSARCIEAARLLGLPQRQMFFRIALPMAWPAIAVGLTLVLLETLNDIGATQYLGVNAMTAAIYQTWVIRDDFRTAVVLSLLLLAVVSLLILIERRLQKRVPRLESQRHQTHASIETLQGWRTLVAVLLASLPPVIGFVLPATVLAEAAYRDLVSQGLRDDVVAAFLSTAWLSLIAISVILTAGFAIALLHRLAGGRLGELALRLSLAGYAIPGLMLVIALMPVAGWLDQSLMQLGITTGAILSGSVALLVIAYSLRFSAISTTQAEAALGQLSHNADHAARTLGAGRLRLGTSILLPQIAPAGFAAAILVLVAELRNTFDACLRARLTRRL